MRSSSVEARPRAREQTVGWGAVLTLSSALLASCAGDDLYIRFERFELSDRQRIDAGSGCALAIERRRFGGGVSSSSGLADPSGDFSVEEQSGEDSYLVVVRSSGAELTRRDYPLSFLRSGDVDRFEVTTQAGRLFELAYRGSDSCDSTNFDE